MICVDVIGAGMDWEVVRVRRVAHNRNNRNTCRDWNMMLLIDHYIYRRGGG